MATKEVNQIALLAIIFILIPILPSFIFKGFDNIIIRIISILFVLWSVSQNITLGVVSLVVVGSLYLERNRRKVIELKKKLEKQIIDDSAPSLMTVEEESEAQKSVPVVDFERPGGEEETYLPKESMGKNDFSTVDETINQKIAIKTIIPGAQSEKFYEQNNLGKPYLL
jgi:hypothetical protein